MNFNISFKKKSNIASILKIWFDIKSIVKLLPNLVYLEACCNDPSSAGSTLGFVPDSIKKITLVLTSFHFNGGTKQRGVIIYSIRNFAAVGSSGEGFL